MTSQSFQPPSTTSKLCRASYLEIRPALYETTIKSKVARNAILGRAEFASSYAVAQKKIEKSIEKLMELGQ